MRITAVNALRAFAAVSLGVLSSAAPAQLRREPPREPDPAAGRIIAERLCVGCHVVGSAADGGPVPAGVPTFASIANRPGQTPLGIAGGIVVPHPPMPDIPLTRDEIRDLAAYIFALRAR